MRISHLSLLEKCKPQLSPSSQDQTSFLAGLAFAPSSDEFERIELVYVANVCPLTFEKPNLQILSVNGVFVFLFWGGGGEGGGAGADCYYINDYASFL